jgi:hypothetical protein
MTPKAMLKTPIDRRRGAVTQETGSWAYLLIDAPPEKVLDALLESKVIGAARRDCLADVRAKRVPRPVGPWGMLVRLKGQPWTYVLGDGLRFEWPKQWAERHGWRVAWFSLDGMINTKVARLYDGTREVFNFTCGLIKGPEEDGFVFHEGFGEDGDDSAMIRGEAKDVCTAAWLKKCKSGGEAMDKLARVADAYLPVSLHHGDDDGKAAIGGWDGDPYPDDEDEIENFPDDAFERVDVFTFGGPETLEPSPAAIALGTAVRAGDAAAARAALADGADPNVMPDDDESPLHVALGLGSPYLPGGRFATVSLDRQLDLLKALLEAGAKPDPQGKDPAIHQAIHWADGGDEQAILAQVRLLLDHGADPNALGTDLRGAGQRPLHVIARFNQWLAVTKLLVSRGADAKLANHAGKTPREFAEARLAELGASLAKHPAPPGGAAGTLQAAASLFAKGLTSDDGDQKKQMLSQLLGNAMKAQSAQHQQDVERLRAVIAFLADAERGQAVVSDIDAVAAASSQRHQEAKRQERAEKEAALAHLTKAREGLLAGLGDLMKGMKPPAGNE